MTTKDETATRDPMVIDEATTMDEVQPQQNHRQAANVLMAYFQEHSIPYRVAVEDFGVCVTVIDDVCRGRTASQIRLGEGMDVASVRTWADFRIPANCVWKVKRVMEAVNARCRFAHLGYSAMTARIYGETQVWYVDAELRPHDVEMAMRMTGSLLLRTIQALIDCFYCRKHVEDVQAGMVNWVNEAQRLGYDGEEQLAAEVGWAFVVD